MKVNELFYSIQGEGKLAGVPSVFIRTTGCNLRCEWCDTPDTSWQPQGQTLSIADILDRVSDYPSRYVVVTGGEPLIADEIEELTRALHDRNLHITIETAGTIYKPVHCDLMSISPKLDNSTPWDREGGRFAESHERTRINIDAIQRLREQAPDCQIKFVVDQPRDLAEIDDLIQRLDPINGEDILLMPQGITRDQLHERAGWLADECKNRGYRYCPRLQIDLYGHRRGT